MPRNPKKGIALADLRLLTRLADYVLPEAGEKLCDTANKCFKEAKLGAECSGSQLSLYMTWCDHERDYPTLTRQVDPNPHYSLATFRKPTFQPAVARKTLETLNTTYPKQLSDTFDYARHYARQWSNEGDRVVADAKTWLTKIGPSVLKNWQDGLRETPEQTEFAAMLHHHLVALRSRIPLPGFLSTDLHRCFFESTAGNESSGSFRAAILEMHPNKAKPWSWKPTWATASGHVLTESKYRPQSYPGGKQNRFFMAIQPFILEYLAKVFNDDFDGNIPETSKANKPQDSAYFLALPVFSRQSINAKGFWHRGGPFLGWILLTLKNKPKQPSSLLKASLALLEPLNDLAARIQEAREQEFWRHRIPGGLDKKSLYGLLRRYAVEFCGAIPKSVPAKAPPVISATSCAKWLNAYPDTVPPFIWPTSATTDNLRFNTFKLTWLKTTLAEGSVEEAKRTALTRFQEASLRLDEIQNAQNAAKHEGRAIAAEEAYAKTAHQLRKLIDRIDKNSPKKELDGLRRYFSLTFLSPKNLQGAATVEIASAIRGGGAFGPYFLKGQTFKDFIISSFQYSAELYPSIEKSHNAKSTFGSKPIRKITFSECALWKRLVWSHDEAVQRDTQPLSDQEAQCLQSKVFWFAALVALWLNTIEHSPEGSTVSLEYEGSRHRLIMVNKAADPDADSGSSRRSTGTEQTLNYYFQCCFPDGDITSQVVFPEKPTHGSFTTKIPIPKKRLLCPPC